MPRAKRDEGQAAKTIALLQFESGGIPFRSLAIFDLDDQQRARSSAGAQRPAVFRRLTWLLRLILLAPPELQDPRPGNGTVCGIVLGIMQGVRGGEVAAISVVRRPPGLSLVSTFGLKLERMHAGRGAVC